MINRQVADMVASKTATTTNSSKKGGKIDVEGIISAIKGMTAASGNADVSSDTAAVAPKKSVAEIAEVQLRSILRKAKLHWMSDSSPTPSQRIKPNGHILAVISSGAAG